MSTITPSRLKEVLNAETFRQLTADNFAILAEEIAKRVASYQNGSPTTIIGPPTSGDRVANEFWRDALGGEWVCTAAGTPGTWQQVRPAAVVSDPSSGTIPVAEALWFSNNAQVQNDYLNAGGDRLVGYLEKIESDEQLVLRATQAVLSRDPQPEEQSAMMQYLNSKPDRRVDAIRQIVWALLSSPEFRFNS